MNDIHKNLATAIERYLQKADDDLEKLLEEEGFANPKETVKHVNNLENQIVDVLTEQSKEFKELLNVSAVNETELKDFIENELPELFEHDNTKGKLYSIFLDDFTTYIPILSNVYISELDSELVVNEISMKTTAWISDWSEELSGLMELSSHTEIENVLNRGLKNGKSIDTISRELMADGIRNEYYKAHRAALTETLRAHSVAREESIQQCPAAEFKEWVHTGGYRNKPRENHVAISGQIVPKNEPFVLKAKNGTTYYPRFPRDTNLPASESVNCHCIHRGVASEKILGLSLEERKKLQQQAIENMNDEWEKELNAQNKARAGIDETKIKYDWLWNKKTVDERKKYFKSNARWALFESGVIKNDADLEKLYTYDVGPDNSSRKRRFKTLTELKNDGIITVSKDRLEHSVLGEWTGTNRLINGSHGQSGIEKLLNTGITPDIYKTYSNGVRIGSISNHKNRTKKTNSGKQNCDIGQSWFPKDWDDDKILLAGTYVANKGTGNDIIKTAIYDNVEVVTFINDNEVGTICPNNMKQPKGDEWENARD